MSQINFSIVNIVFLCFVSVCGSLGEGHSPEENKCFIIFYDVFCKNLLKVELAICLELVM